jgi:hypothetical protein
MENKIYQCHQSFVFAFLNIQYLNKTVVVVVLVVGAYQHCSHEGLLYSNPPNGVP